MYMNSIDWLRYPLVAECFHARTWLTIQANLGLAQNTIEAYGRALEDYFVFSKAQSVTPAVATRVHIAAYVRDLASRAVARRSPLHGLGDLPGLSNATIQQRLTVLRLFYTYLLEEHVRLDSPIGRGHYTPEKGFGGTRERGLVRRYEKLPWLPSEDQWLALLEAARHEPLRNRVMFALSYDAGLRREELCLLATGDLDPAHRLVRIRAETTKNHRERTVPYSETTSSLYAAYLQHRRTLSSARGPLFLSESRRNHAQPISIWTWSKVVHDIAQHADVPQFTPHTLRHMCLTDLARAGWDVHEIATFAGHRSIQTTLRYIHVSGRELAAKLEQGMASIHRWRLACMQEVLG
jgi:integrase/recombinase XerD